MFCSASEDKEVKIWEMNTWKCIKCFAEHKVEVKVAQFSHDDRFIYSGGSDTKIIKWEVDTLKKVF